jgi:serine/threonine protein phosphatase PrpC
MGGERGLDLMTSPAAVPNASAMPWRSSAATRCGPRHEVNEDCYREIEAVGLFAVADGLGGYTDGGLASRSVIEILDCVTQEEPDFETRIEIVEHALQSVNAALWREARQRPEGTVIASTVAVLMLGGKLAVCLWAGDSRIYVYRAGHLYQLTDDHNAAAEGGVVGKGGEALTRAVGAAAELELGRVVTPAEMGDTFLICSDGVPKVMQDIELAQFLDGPLEGLAMRIVAAAVAKGGTDDTTAVIVRYEGE